MWFISLLVNVHVFLKVLKMFESIWFIQKHWKYHIHLIFLTNCLEDILQWWYKRKKQNKQKQNNNNNKMTKKPGIYKKKNFVNLTIQSW